MQQQNVTASYNAILSITKYLHLLSGSTVRCTLLLLFHIHFSKQKKKLGGSKQHVHFNGFKGFLLCPVAQNDLCGKSVKIDLRGEMWMK